ncbi:hypothetical protein [Vibrio parahaemolyticus]|uniref:hypothetical protein n=1 Tax=Vibrio parahaemolyticus TaxID=670 RepID=UPI00215CC2AE|nr:hypothetical protein [Vibrio parahaemolyticus]EGQ8535744.1 hypothetical protein [Vibrio parahaemolyticus]EJB8505210.1 hypothetical protein [Vibrio parahaemolyticus]EJL3960106.1 hypothetical protein [Vibrio parahaemolyticus]MCR9868075.1 hypothetical protein [Vibrio parahaemolyticus]
MIVSRSKHSHEPDLLADHEAMPLRIVDLDGVEVVQLSAPNGGWHHDTLEYVDYDSMSPDGWDAYLGTQLIGSSEV